MEYRVLGPLEVLDASGRKVSLGGAMEQSVLASLLLRAGQTVALDRLIDELWNEPPATAARTVQAYVSRLRRKLPEGAIARRAGGYEVVLAGDELDLTTFEQRAEDGRAALAAEDYERSARLLEQALALWRGPALGGLTSEALRREAERLEELRLSVLEDRIGADFGAGRHAEIVGELTALVGEHPFREHLREQLMIALYRSARPTEALAVYRDARRLLTDELGLEPGQELRDLEQAILRQDAALEPPTRRRSVAFAELPTPDSAHREALAPARELRKTVTILFCDVVGSTALGESSDPEVVRSLLADYFERMKKIVEHHGGTVEKFIGDAVMAVFGVPIAHEDDALRACRAALEMRTSLASLDFEGRIGVTTGEVVTGTEERLVTGDPVNVAARLEQTAKPGEVVIDERTLRLVSETAEVGKLTPRVLSGKTHPVPVYELLGVRDVRRRHETTFVGRELELATIHEAWQRTLAQKRCDVALVVGEAGVGKSRLVAEALTALDVRVVQGRCLPYGEGITYWPVVEVIKQLDAEPLDQAAAIALRSLHGLSEASVTAEEIAWGFRRLLEEQAPLIVVFDDIQWAEETFLDLIDHLALLSSDGPTLVICTARPELLERRSHWHALVRLEPLPQHDIEELIGERASPALGARIARAAGGNPLFVSEMLSMAGQLGDDVAVPPSLRALLAARLDQLQPGERRALERASIEGEVFHRGAVRALSLEEAQVTPHLAALARKGLITRHAAEIPGDDGFRFRHLLIREVAYDGLPKAGRAALHEQLADWLEERRLGVEFDAILGHHLEQSALYKGELGATDLSLIERAAGRLAAAGRAALARGDGTAAVSLLSRAADLVRTVRPDPDLELDLAIAYTDVRPEQGCEIAESVADRAREQGDTAGETVARAVAAQLRAEIAAHPDVEELDALAHKALGVLGDGQDHQRAITRVQVALSHVAIFRCRFADLEVLSQTLMQGELGYEQGAVDLGVALVYGPRPADEGLRTLEELLADHPHPHPRLHRAYLLAMLERYDEAWELGLQASTRLLEMGNGPSDELGHIARLAGDDEAAARYFCTYFDWCEKYEWRAQLSTAAPLAGLSLCALGRFDEAESHVKLGRESASDQDLSAQFLWRQLQARLHADKGDHFLAEKLAREATAFTDETDSLNSQADARADLAEVLNAGGQTHAAVDALKEALDRYEMKRNLAMAGRVRARLADLEKASAQDGASFS